MLNSTNTVSASCVSESRMVCSTSRQFSAMSEHSSVKGSPTAIRDWLMSSAQDFPVPLFPCQEKTWAKPTAVTCGQQRLTSYAEYDRDLHSWRTSQISLLTHTSDEFSEIWSKVGLIADGVCFPQPMLERRIAEIDSGSSQEKWPTPTAGDHKGAALNRFLGSETYRHNLKEAVRTSETDGHLNPEWVEWLMGWPIGHTALKPLGTDKFLEFLRQHGNF